MSGINTDNTISSDRTVSRQREKEAAEKALKSVGQAQNYYKEVTDKQEELAKVEQEFKEKNKAEADASRRKEESQHYEQTGRLLG